MSKWLRTLLTVLGGLILVGTVVMGLTQAGGVEQRSARDFDLEAAREELSGAPPPVAALYARGNDLLGGGRRAFEDTMRSLRGHPVVINKWASWCGPCRAEFPMFQDIATERGKEIAFVGVNSRDATPAARRFLDEHPLPFPSFEDPGEKIAGALDSPSNFPVTLFVDEKGETVYVHQGSYRSSDELAADIDEHLGA